MTAVRRPLPEHLRRHRTLLDVLAQPAGARAGEGGMESAGETPSECVSRRNSGTTQPSRVTVGAPSMGAEQEVKVLWGILTEENPHQRQGRRREAGSDGSRR